MCIHGNTHEDINSLQVEVFNQGGVQAKLGQPKHNIFTFYHKGFCLCEFFIFAVTTSISSSGMYDGVGGHECTHCSSSISFI